MADIRMMGRRADDPPRRRRLRKGVYILPSLATAFNMAFGYYAIYHTFLGSPSDPLQYDYAAKAIGFAVVFDGLDGRIARMTNTTSDFGRELDSLADVITFGVAPAILAWVWGFRWLMENGVGHEWMTRIQQLGAIAGFAFLVAGACRLARFNIQANPQPSNPGRPGKKYFVGMPIPAGAGVVAAVVHFVSGWPIRSWWMGGVWAALVLTAGLLMVSTWRFYSFKDLDFRSRHPARLVFLIAFVIAAVWFFSQIVLFALAMIYMASGLVFGLKWTFRRRGSPPPAYKEAPQAQ